MKKKGITLRIGSLYTLSVGLFVAVVIAVCWFYSFLLNAMSPAYSILLTSLMTLCFLGLGGKVIRLFLH